MKLLLLHGPAISSSRKKLLDLKEKFDPNSVVVLDKDVNPKDLQAILATGSLFPEDRLVILENPPDDLGVTYTLASRSELYPIPYTLIFWFDHEISATASILQWVKKEGEILFFPEAKEISVFPFLDLLAAKDQKAFLEMDKLKKRGFDIFYLITMVFYLLRVLTVTPKNAQAFVKEKLIGQRKNFNLKKIENLYKDILEIEYKIKSGLLEKPQAEFLLVNKFIL